MKRPNVDHARALRTGQTDAERALWRQLRDRQLPGWKFRRQHEIGPYIADFVCTDAWLSWTVASMPSARSRMRGAPNGCSTRVIVCCVSGMMMC